MPLSVCRAHWLKSEGSKMNEEAKKSLKKLIFAGISILFMAANVKATFVDANAVEEGLEYYIRIDKGVYDLEENIEMLCRVTNVGNETLNVCDLGIYTLSLELTRPQGDTLFSPYFGPPFGPMPPGLPDIITLNPGEYIETQWLITSGRWGVDREWVEEPFSIVGQYSITSKYDNSWLDPHQGPLALEPDALDFAIIPEPTTVLFIALGGLAVFRCGRGRRADKNR
jgi:hypothetical protein